MAASPTPHAFDLPTVVAWLADARQRTLSLVEDLSDEQFVVPRIPIVNPPLWEVGHVGWFQERWLSRHVFRLPPRRANADALYDSSRVAHDLRWELPLPDLGETLRDLSAGLTELLERLQRLEDEPPWYFLLLALFHEDMHGEAFAYTRQTLGYAAPAPATAAPPAVARIAGDVRIPGGRFRLGSPREEPFVFDNEKWSHAVDLSPFSIARTAVTQAEFLEFVEAKGYQRRELWSEAGWRWRSEAQALHPVYWRREGRVWRRRHFDRWLDLEPDLPALHVSWFEADAYCRWAGRRLPTEAEWELAAIGEPGAPPDAARRFPWGDGPPTAERANLDGASGGPVSVHALPAGDSAFGCRQMVGNVWEWTQSDFAPYPGFAADPYEDYSKPWFGTHKVLRGGAWATRSRLIRPRYRNFYTPDRRDVLAGFRSCAR